MFTADRRTRSFRTVCSDDCSCCLVDPDYRRHLAFDDVTVISVLTREGRPQSSETLTPLRMVYDGAALAFSERHKHAAYPELFRPGLERLRVFTCETGKR